MNRELEEWHKLHQFHLNSGGYQTKDLAEYLGVSTRTIQRWLKEKSDPDDKEMAQIREYLNKSRLEQESAL